MTEKAKPKIVQYHQLLMNEITDEIRKNTEDIYKFDKPQLYIAIQNERIRMLEKLIRYLDYP